MVCKGLNSPNKALGHVVLSLVFSKATYSAPKQVLNPKPQTQNPKPQTPNPEPQTLNPQSLKRSGFSQGKKSSTGPSAMVSAAKSDPRLGKQAKA